MKPPTVISKAVYDHRGALVGHTIDTYSPVSASPIRTAPQTAQTAPCTCGCHLATQARDDDDYPDDEPRGWGTPASGRLATQASAGEEDYPADNPDWS